MRETRRTKRPSPGAAAPLWRAAAPLLALLAFGALRPAAAQESSPGEAPRALPDTWYAQALAYAESGINVTHFWSKGSDKLRAETVIAGHRVVSIVNGPTYYAYDLLTGQGIAVQRSPTAIAQDEGRGRPFGRELDTLLRLGGERIGTERLAGRPVEVYQVTDGVGKRQVWVSADPRRLTIRLKLFRRATGQTLHTDFLNWAQGLPITDSFFDPEPSVELLRLGFDEYVKQQSSRKPLGPVPVLYTDLLHGY